jgi:hypothetical protein
LASAAFVAVTMHVPALVEVSAAMKMEQPDAVPFVTA